MQNNEPNFTKLLSNWLAEDGTDITSMATIDSTQKGKMELLVKENCVIAGIDAIQELINSKEYLSDNITFVIFKLDGENVEKGTTAFYIFGPILILLRIERIILNLMQRMSGIATKTQKYVAKCKPYDVQVLVLVAFVTLNY